MKRSSNHPSARRQSAADIARTEYWIRVRAQVERIINARCREGSEDVEQMVAEQFLANTEQIMAAYEPEVFANVAVRSRADDWRRTERIQKGEGARMYRDPADDLAKPGRQVCSIDSIDEALVDAVIIAADAQQSTVDALEVREALTLLDENQRKLVFLVDVQGYTVVEAAPMVSLSRAYAQRRLGAARETIISYVIAA